MNEEDEKTLPPYLRKDASYIQCCKCGRKSWAEEVNSVCNMPQPDGKVCDGILEGLR